MINTQADMRPPAAALLRIPLVIKKMENLYPEESPSCDESKMLATIRPTDDYSKLNKMLPKAPR